MSVARGGVRRQKIVMESSYKPNMKKPVIQKTKKTREMIWYENTQKTKKKPAKKKTKKKPAKKKYDDMIIEI
ncbi:unnamed protein product [marine sediment metagenome]|uniref:Uncharacterized protein n=1 Tax=marine sediment metagenome TaxID=412755 RepID=X1C460_9ZZZZ